MLLTPGYLCQPEMRFLLTPPEELYREIPLTKGKVALVSPEDYEDLIKWKWQARLHPRRGCFYVTRSVFSDGVRGVVLMHRQIMGLEAGDKRVVDHRNDTTLDNRRSNLRIATNSENLCNRGKQKDNKSGYKGVCWHRGAQKWVAQIKKHRKMYYLGLHETPELAHRAYCEAAKELHGEFAKVA